MHMNMNLIRGNLIRNVVMHLNMKSDWFASNFTLFVGEDLGKAFEIHRSLQGNTFFAAVVLKASKNELQEILYVACSDPTWHIKIFCREL